LAGAVRVPKGESGIGGAKTKGVQDALTHMDGYGGMSDYMELLTKATKPDCIRALKEVLEARGLGDAVS